MEQRQDGPAPAQSLEHAELQPEPKLDPKSQPEPELDPKSQPEPKVDPKSQPEPKVERKSQPEPKLDPKSQPESKVEPKSQPEPGAEAGGEPGPDAELGLGSEPGPGFEPGPGSEPGSDWQRQQRIAARRNRVDVRRREALGEKVEKEEEEEEEEEERKSLKVIEETGKVLAKLLFHGTQLLTNVRVEADLRESRRREKEGEEKRRRLEKLEWEAKHGTEKLAEINSKWALAGDLKIPQELWELLEQQQDQCQQLLTGKNRLIRELQQELEAKDSQYEQALREQEGEIRVLLERMEEQSRNLVRSYRHHIRHIEKTLEEERREMLVNNRERWNEAMQAHNEQELQFLRERMDKALEFEKLLNELEAESVESYDSTKFQLERDVQYLEKRLRQMKGLYHLNQVKLEYNLDVLRQLDVENSTLRSLQKRKINRLQTSLSLLRTKMAKQEKKFQEEKQSLEWELERITGQFQETRSRLRDLALSGAEKFRRVWMANEEEAKALIREALDADRIIHVQQLGMPWEEPRLWFMDNVGPPGGRREKREAMEAATELLEDFPIHGYSWSISHSNHETLRIEDEAELRKLMDFFLFYGCQGVTDSQDMPGENPADPAQDGGEGGSQFQRDELQSLESSVPARSVDADDVLKILKEFLRDFPKLRDEGPPREIQEIRDNSKDGEYWQAMTRVIPEGTLKLWDALGAALLEYHKVLTRRSELFSRAAALQRQNSELGILLEEYLGSGHGR
ncbi:PREDICTED: dynein regulatory complex protein 1 [Sturnus vulgaris]|uniref:dynein regulatory complex protein 1 n=1 Tax=Sturnus vulgaris TaxID=9172 RepID=UPI00071A9B2E|nr:PREDICTED: dynein regulatory complex protein 1 [Sturnus vulgaris]